MKEKPISPPDWKVRALPHATQVRVVMKPQPPDTDAFIMKCPYPVGTKLWVREAYRTGTSRSKKVVLYRATDDPGMLGSWCPPRSMRREFSRYTLEVTGVKAERLQEISLDDGKAEGVEPYYSIGLSSSGFVAGFAQAWDSTAKPGEKWADNPWVFALTVKTLEGV